MTKCPGRKFLAWTVALGLALVALLGATAESLRHPEVASPFTEAGQPDRQLGHAPVDDTYHDPGLAVWPTP